MNKYEVIWRGDVYKQEADYVTITGTHLMFYKDNRGMRTMIAEDVWGKPPVYTSLQTPDEFLAGYPSDAIVRKIA